MQTHQLDRLRLLFGCERGRWWRSINRRQAGIEKAALSRSLPVGATDVTPDEGHAPVTGYNPNPPKEGRDRPRWT